MDKIYITNTLLDFKTKIIPKNAIIINLEKFNNNDFLKTIISRLDINEIICENKELQKYVSKILNKEVINIEELEIKCSRYQDKSVFYFLYYISLASFTSFFFFSLYIKKRFLIAMILIVNLFIWLVSYYFLMKKQPWENVIIDN